MSPDPRFDAYAPTLREVELESVVKTMQRELGCGARGGAFVRRYGQVVDMHIGADLVAWAGFDRATETVYLEAKGETTPEVVSVIRGYWPKHSVARADACADWDGEGMFEYLQDVARSVKGQKVKAGFVRLPDDPKEGRTWSIGQRGGVAYARLYEAGKQKEKAHWCRPHAVRFEVEARPHYASDKVAASTMTPVQLLGITPWSRRVAAALLQREVERFDAEVRVSTHDRTTVYLARAFRRHFTGMLEDLGSWECVGRELASVWSEDDELAAKLAELKARRS